MNTFNIRLDRTHKEGIGKLKDGSEKCLKNATHKNEKLKIKKKKRSKRLVIS